jgi:DNA-binding cell septation regulator SpoVG
MLSKKIAIMQPYFLPYLGYFQLMNAVDEFVIYDNIQFSKRGWIHRNRILENGKDIYVSLPIQKDSDYLNVNERLISGIFEDQRKKILNKVKNNYSKAPYFEKVYPLLEEIVTYDNNNLFEFIYNSIKKIKDYLEILTPIVISSGVKIDHNLKGSLKVKAIVKARNGDVYINSIGGKELYSKENFLSEGIELKFLETNPYSYSQFKNEFIPFLSVIDTMMFNSVNDIQELLNKCKFQ